MAIRVLVVDDEEIVRNFFIRLLGIHGYEVTAVKDGYEAIEIVEKKSFNMIFLDMCMPRLGGIKTLQAIRKIDPKVPVVMITGFAVEETLEEAKKEGAHRSIKKPFKIDQITELIAELSCK